MTQPLSSASRKLAAGATRSRAVCAWDAEPVAEPSLELLLLLPPLTNSSYLFGRSEGSSERQAAAAQRGGLAAGDDSVRRLPLVGVSPNAGRPRTASRAARNGREQR